MTARIRIAEADDAAAVLRMFDGIVEWLESLGRTGQWGTERWSETPLHVERLTGQIERGELWVAEEGPADVPELLGVIALSETCGTYVSPPPEPELFINLLGTSRAAKGRDIGGLLLAQARAETRRRGLRLLRVDCYSGGDRRLNRWYVDQGFTEVGPFVVKRTGRPDWPGMLLQEYLES
jgi:GNAT superfamily N-acetyltransferase